MTPPTPKPVPTLAERQRRARRAVELYKSGVAASVALRQVGMPTHYGEAVRECAEGGGPLTRATLADNLAAFPERAPTSLASFIRWYHKKDPINGVDAPGLQELLADLRQAIADGVSVRSLAGSANLSRWTIHELAKGRRPRLRPERCPALRLAIDSLWTPKTEASA